MRAVDGARERIERLEAEGDHLLAYDAAIEAATNAPEDVYLRYLAVRNLARCGATRAALTLYEQYRLGDSDELDFRALRARLEKDIALRSGGAAREKLLKGAAERYAAIYQDVGGYYPAVNAATLYLLSGEPGLAAGFARETLGCCAREPGQTELDQYYCLASEAEAHIVLGETLEALETLHRLARLGRDNLAARATTRRQLRRLLRAKNLNDSILEPLNPPQVLHYCGHRFPLGRAAASTEVRIRNEIEAMFDAHRIGVAFGSLAGGSDILFAEECIRRGIELNLVFPFALADFVKVSVAPLGENCQSRFEQCRRAAKSVLFATDGDYLGDDEIFAYAGRLAMGLTALRSQYIDSDAMQCAVWDGQPARGRGGTAVDVQTWRATGRKCLIIPAQQPETAGTGTPVEVKRPYSRELRALIFADTVGFSRVPERLVPKFREVYLRGMASIMRQQRSVPLHVSSWGDAIYCVMDSTEGAGQCALEMQGLFKSIDHRIHGFSDPPQLRMSIHFGPVFCGRDEFNGAITYFGTHVTRAARIEPITPPGEVYVTEQFAADLVLNNASALAGEYVGPVALAKGFGTTRMYVLRRREQQ